MFDFGKWKKTDTINYECEEDIKELLFGRKVEKVSGDMLLLDNGILLEIVPNKGCVGCGAGCYHIKELNGCDNAITSVEFCDDKIDGKNAYAYKIFVFAEDKRVKLLQVDGEDGNGYWYGTGYDIFVRVKEEE